MSETWYVSVVEINGDGEKKYFLVTDHGGVILAQKSKEDALHSWEEAYNRAHGRGPQASTGAIMHWMQIRPSIIGVNGVEDITERIIGPGPDYHKFSLWGEGGGCTGIPATQPGIAQLWAEGAKPRLIS